jgi:hypothetical protein
MEGMWIKCTVCRATIFKREVDRNLKVCPKCHYHFPMSIEERVELIADSGTFQEWDADLVPGDPLQFEDTLPYQTRVHPLPLVFLIFPLWAAVWVRLWEKRFVEPLIKRWLPICRFC